MEKESVQWRQTLEDGAIPCFNFTDHKKELLKKELASIKDG